MRHGFIAIGVVALGVLAAILIRRADQVPTAHPASASVSSKARTIPPESSTAPDRGEKIARFGRLRTLSSSRKRRLFGVASRQGTGIAQPRSGQGAVRQEPFHLEARRNDELRSASEERPSPSRQLRVASPRPSRCAMSPVSGRSSSTWSRPNAASFSRSAWSWDSRTAGGRWKQVVSCLRSAMASRRATRCSSRRPRKIGITCAPIAIRRWSSAATIRGR